MDIRRVTVFGGSGFIGRHLVRKLAKSGAVVRVAVRHPGGADYLKTMGDAGQIVPVRADIRDHALVAAAAEGADAVVNLVGILYERRRNSFEAIHVDGAERVARAAAAVGAGRMVHLSALGADPSAPAVYARSKAAGEAAVLEAFPGAAILRPSVVFGPEDDFFNRFAALARVMPVLPLYGVLPRVEFTGLTAPPRLDLYGTGGTRFQPVYVGDVAEAAMRLLADGGAQGAIYELGGPRCYTFKEIFELALAEIGRKRLIVPLPFWVARLQAAFLELLPVPPLTRDQVDLLKRDSVVSEGALTLADLGIEPMAAEAVVPRYLDRFRRHGRWSRQRAV